MLIETISVLTLIGTILTFVAQIFQSCMTGAFESDCGCCSFTHNEDDEKDIKINVEVVNEQSNDTDHHKKKKT